MIKIFPISAFNDNYIWVILHPASSQAVVIDPGQASPVIERFQQENLQLCGILLTHHHWDHTGGVKALLKQNSIPVYGPPTIDLVSHPVKEGDHFSIEAIDADFKVIEIPGHTLDHIAYRFEKNLFCGDTLFTAGCGRVFEGSPEQMYQSLQKLAALPPETNVYCGHEYTVANLRFAETVEPQNEDIKERMLISKANRKKGSPTVPAPLSIELKTNPFLRCHINSVQLAASAHSEQNLVDPIEIFTEIRSWKDNFIA